MGVRHATALFLLLDLVAIPAFALDGPTSQDEVSKEFEATTLPLVKRYCLECHSTEEQEGELDLERFTTPGPRPERPSGLAAGRRDARQRRDAPEGGPPAGRRRTGAAPAMGRRLPRAEAIRRAGDPGRVVLRRLNNAEYTYTLRDLTGLDSLDPAREFPVDGAAGEGFTNTGNALVMSPSLLDEVPRRGQGGRRPRGPPARRLPVLARDDPPRLDRGDPGEDPRVLPRVHRPRAGGDQVNLQGIVFDTNQGGRLPLEKYLAATIAERGRVDIGREERRGRRPRTRLERQVSRHALEEPSRTPSRRSCSTASGPAGKAAKPEDVAGARRRDRRLAEGALEVLQRRPYRQGGRPEGVDGAGQPAGRPPGGPVQDPARRPTART